ncbi:MAG: redox-regulated ATPase YchF, partial [Deltaproteobacteria bacterium]|nr:redox-regulated ATPase YchF [Deltaproteobacteria bacterium]
VRCFEDPNVVHVSGSINPLRDVGVINTELILADLETVCRRLDRAEKHAKGQDKKALQELNLLKEIKNFLDEGKLVRHMKLSEEAALLVKDLCLLTSKPVLYVANISEELLHQENETYEKLKTLAQSEGSEILKICGKIESELIELDDLEKKEFLKELGIQEPGLHQLIRSAFKLLNLRTFFTAGPTEVRAWTIKAHTKAPQAAGVIHSDFERGFIRAEIYHYNDLIQYGSELAVKSKGLMRLEGKEYEVQDGDIVFFRFAV